MTIQQLSIFIENKSGTLLKVLQLLKEAKIQLVASTIADTVEYGIYRIICSEPSRAYAVLKDFYKRLLEVDDDAVYARMSKLLEGKESATLQVDTRFSGTRADESLRGSITGISTQNFTPEELTYGFLEGIIKELFDLYQTMGVQRSGLIASGNGIRKNAALQRIAQRYFGAELKIPAYKEEAACGAALFALISAGYFKNAAEAQKLICLKG